MIITIAIVAMMTMTNDEIRVDNMNDASIHCASLHDYHDSIDCMRNAYNAYKYDDSMIRCENDESTNCIFLGNVEQHELSFIDVNNIAYYLTLNDRIMNV